MYFHEAGYSIDGKPAQLSATSTEGNYDTKGRTVLIQNTGSKPVYLSGTTGVDNTCWPIPAGSIIEHITGKFYYACTSTDTSTLSVLTLGGV